MLDLAVIPRESAPTPHVRSARTTRLSPDFGWEILRRRGVAVDRRPVDRHQVVAPTGRDRRAPQRRRGSRMVTTVPCGVFGAASTVPPCCAAVWATMARPRPEPGIARAAGAR